MRTIEAISYGRFSSKPQELGDSETRQEQGYRSVLQRYPQLVESSRYGFGKIFVRGQSAFHSEGEHLSLILDMVRSGEIQRGKSALVIDEWSRFSRMEPDLAVNILSEIVRAGVPVVVASPDMWCDDASIGGTQFIIIAMLLQQAHQASADRRRHSCSSRERIRQSGHTKHGIKPASCPFWLSVGDDGNYHENDFAPTVKEMFRLSLLDHGAATIKTMLGNPTRTLAKKGKTVEIDVLGVLRNRAAIGEYKPYIRTNKNKDRKEAGQVQTGYYPSVVDDDTFFRVQTALDSRRKQRGRKGKFVTNLFQELFIGDDGLPMHIWGRGEQRRLRRKTKGLNRSWDYHQVEYTLLRFLKELRLKSTSPAATDFISMLADVDSRINSIKHRLETDSDMEVLMDVLGSLNKKRQTILAAQEAEKGKIPACSTLSDTHAILTALKGCQGDELLTLRTRLRGMIRRLVSRIGVKVYASPRACWLGITLTDGTKREIVIQNGARKVSLNIVEDGSVCQEVWRVAV